MTNTETCMREMRCLISMLKTSQSFNEQWILFKAYLNLVHSMQDNDKHIQTFFFVNDLLNFILVLRNILHHQPEKFHFGKHSVFPKNFSVEISQEKGGEFKSNWELIIEKTRLEDENLQAILGDNSKKQLNVLRESLKKMEGHISVLDVMENSQVCIEKYCKENNKYTEAYDMAPSGYILTKIT